MAKKEQSLLENINKEIKETGTMYILVDVNMTYLGSYMNYEVALEDAKYYAKRGDYSDVLYILKKVTKVELNTIIRDLGD